MIDRPKTQQEDHSVGGPRRGGHTQLTSVFLAAVIYAAAYYFLFYYVEIFDTDSDAVAIGGFILFNAVFGFVIGRWWSLLLPVTMVLLSIYYWTKSPLESALYWEIIFYIFVPTAVASIAGGVVIRRFIERPRE